MLQGRRLFALHAVFGVIVAAGLARPATCGARWQDGNGAAVPPLLIGLESYARSTGGRPFFPRTVKELDGVFDDIVADRANQYVL